MDRFGTGLKQVRGVKDQCICSEKAVRGGDEPHRKSFEFLLDMQLGSLKFFWICFFEASLEFGAEGLELPCSPLL